MEPQTLLRDGERYELLDELASGGMATVFLARMRRPMGFSRLVAIKCMHPQFAKDPSFVSMFMDEARLTARLRHPNIVPTLDIVEGDGHLLLVMEYVEGASLATLLRSAHAAGVRVPPAIACAIVHDLLLGLHAAHQAKDDEGVPLSIIHRDVSPQNVLVGLDGLSRVLDFGVAKARQNTHLSNDNEIKGKIPYMPPEQLFGEALDHRADVYAAGVTLWEALVCERLFDGPSETALVRQISEAPIDRPSARCAAIPAELDAFVMKALSRDAGARYESALAMAEAIAGFIALPTRTEISAWVRQYVAPREVPSGTKLPVAEPALEPVTKILAILERASLVTPAPRRDAPSVLVAPRSRPASRIALASAALAFAVAGLVVARVAKSEAAQPKRDVRTSVSAAAELVLPAVTVQPAAPLAPIVPVATAANVQPAARIAPRTGHATTARTSPPASPDRKATCKIPYTIDAQGQKHYKVECL